MMIHLLLCVLLCVSQMETLTLTAKKKSLLQHEKFVNQEEKLLASLTEKLLLDHVRAKIEPLKDFPAEAVQIALSRSKRQVFKHNECPDGKVKLGGICVTCDEYEDSTDKDCPIKQQNKGHPIEQENEIYDDY